MVWWIALATTCLSSAIAASADTRRPPPRGAPTADLSSLCADRRMAAIVAQSSIARCRTALRMLRRDRVDRGASIVDFHSWPNSRSIDPDLADGRRLPPALANGLATMLNVGWRVGLVDGESFNIRPCGAGRIATGPGFAIVEIVRYAENSNDPAACATAPRSLATVTPDGLGPVVAGPIQVTLSTRADIDLDTVALLSATRSNSLIYTLQRWRDRRTGRSRLILTAAHMDLPGYPVVQLSASIG